MVATEAPRRSTVRRQTVSRQVCRKRGQALGRSGASPPFLAGRLNAPAAERLWRFAGHDDERAAIVLTQLTLSLAFREASVALFRM